MPFKPNWEEDLAEKAVVKHKYPFQELKQFHEKRVKHFAEDLFVATLPEVGYGDELREEHYDVKSGTRFIPSGMYTMQGRDMPYLFGLEQCISRISRTKKNNEAAKINQCCLCHTDFSPTWAPLDSDEEKIVCERCYKKKLMKKMTKNRYDIIRYHSSKVMAEQLQRSVCCTQIVREQKYQKKIAEKKKEGGISSQKENESTADLEAEIPNAV